MTQDPGTQNPRSLREVFIPQFARCPKCRQPLQPQTRTCQACGHKRLPLFMQSLWLVALAGAGVCGLIALLFRFGDTDRHLVVSIAGVIFCVLSLVFAIVLRRGRTDGWYAWTVILGMAVAASAMMIMIVLGDSHRAHPLLPYAFLGITVGYAGWMWRTRSQAVWAVASGGYVLASSAFSIWMMAAHARHELVILTVGFGLILIVAALLLAIAYAVPVRWWHNVGLGWEGAKLAPAGSKTGTESKVPT